MTYSFRELYSIMIIKCYDFRETEDTRKRKLEGDDSDVDDTTSTPRRGRGRPPKNPRHRSVTEIVLPPASPRPATSE